MNHSPWLISRFRDRRSLLICSEIVCVLVWLALDTMLVTLYISLQFMSRVVLSCDLLTFFVPRVTLLIIKVPIRTSHAVLRLFFCCYPVCLFLSNKKQDLCVSLFSSIVLCETVNNPNKMLKIVHTSVWLISGSGSSRRRRRLSS